MIADKMKNMVANSSAIRAMFEEGNRLAGIYGAENVFDFSLGNPNVPAPEAVKNAIIEIVNDTDPVALHGYTNSNCGYAEVRAAVAKSLNERFDTHFEGKNIVMTVGAAAGIQEELWRHGNHQKVCLRIPDTVCCQIVRYVHGYVQTASSGIFHYRIQFS